MALFDLEHDPGELHDLGRDPRYAGIRLELLSRVLDGWDPDLVRREAVARTRDYRMVANWGSHLGGALPELLKPPPGTGDDVEIL